LPCGNLLKFQKYFMIFQPLNWYLEKYSIVQSQTRNIKQLHYNVSCFCHDEAHLALNNNHSLTHSLTCLVWYDNKVCFKKKVCVFVEFCIYNGIAYRQGQSWQDGCSKTCRCEDAAARQVTCTDRYLNSYHRFTYEKVYLSLLMLRRCNQKL
jgi:hypothetical protein